MSLRARCGSPPAGWGTGSAWKWRTPAWASPRRTCPRSSSGFTGWIRPALGRPGGTGLGLSIVRDAVRRHGGDHRGPQNVSRRGVYRPLLAEEGGRRRELRPQSGFRPFAGPAHLDSLGRVRPNREESGYLVYYRNQAAVDSAGAAEARWRSATPWTRRQTLWRGFWNW